MITERKKMNQNEYEEIFFNRAEKIGEEEIHCENCSESVVFLLRDRNHTFSIGLKTVLECLVFAIQNGDLPKLPLEWLTLVDHAYDTNFHDMEDISYYDYDAYCERKKQNLYETL